MKEQVNDWTMIIKDSEIRNYMRDVYTQKELNEMSDEEWDRAHSECREEIAVGIMEDEQDRQMYGDMRDDDYCMSDAHRADVQAEQWDWLKNE